MFLAHPTVPSLISAIMDHSPQPDDVAVILLGEKNLPDLNALIAELNQHKISFFGAFFPAVISGDQAHEEGAIIQVLPALAPPFLISTKQDMFLLDEIKTLVEEQSQRYLAMMFVDALTTNVALLISELFNQVGSSISYLGGGAGSLSLQQMPCIFTPDGLFQDAAVIALVKVESCINVRHGWQQVMGPIVATKTHNNVVMELNWRNAFDLYRMIVEQDSGNVLTHENFYDIATGYPFGLHCEGAEDIVRAPVALTEKGELIFVIDIPENAVFYLRHGSRDSLVAAAAEVAASCSVPPDRKPTTNLVIDCISRVLYLDDHFHHELSAIQTNLRNAHPDASNLTPEGALTLGEIAPDAEGVVQLYNKTIVVGVLYE